MSGKQIAALVSSVTTLSFVYAILFEVGWLTGQNALGLLWFFSFTDYVNTSIPTMLGMVSALSAYILFEGLFFPSLLEVQVREFGEVLKNPRWDREQMPPRKKPTRWSWFSLGISVILSGILFWLAPALIPDDTMGITVAATGSLFIFSVCMAGTSVLIHYLPTRPALIIQILISVGALFAIFGFMSATVHASTPIYSYRVTTPKGIVISEQVLNLDRGLALIRPTGFLLVSWDQISSLEYRQRNWEEQPDPKK